MFALLMLLSVLAALGGLACAIIILVDAFQDAVWKGFVALLCGLYWLYYAIFEFDHENKWLIFLGAIGGGAISEGLRRVAMGYR